jgi:hypothetical protein
VDGTSPTSPGSSPRRNATEPLCELLVSELYALTYRHETLAFQRVPTGQADMIEEIILALAVEWRAAYRDYQADEARQLVAWLHIAGRR